MGSDERDSADLGMSTAGLLAALAETPSAGEVIPEGTVLADRFRLLGRLGAGGMGVVYRARDARLGRDVAIKVVRDDSELGQQRLLREATAMAQLSHPNVVTAYDVGTWAHGVFIAMELVEGENLRRWLTDRPRTWREVRDVFVAAGAGLLAMHAAGLVHRDFKPGNVLIDAAGRVRVTDLGLVRAAGHAGDADEEPLPEGDARALLDEDTRGTSISGTPGYIAPEQLAGQPLDARADQYAFGVAMDAALPRTAPARLRTALARARAARPEDRFPSLEPLLAALRYDPARTRNRVLLALALGALGALATFGLVRKPRPACDGAATLVGAWDAAARERVRAAFAATGRPYAADTFTRAAAALDRYAGGLAAASSAACEAAVTQSSTLSDLRQACVDGRRDGLAALVHVLGEADGAVVTRALQAVADLPDVAACAQSARLLEHPLPPGAREAVSRVEARLGSVRALLATGRYPRSQELAAAVVDEARATGWPPLEARALATRAEALIELRDTAADDALRAAWLAAAAAGDDELVADNVSRLIFYYSDTAGKAAEAEALFTTGDAAVLRTGSKPLVRARMLTHQANAMMTRGDYGGARRPLLEAVLLGDVAGEPPSSRAKTWNNLSVAYRRLGTLAEAEAAIRRSLALSQGYLGPDHPFVGGARLNLAAVMRNRGRYEEAAAESDRAIRILEAALGPDNAQVGMAKNNLAEVLHLMGRDADALPALDQALAIKQKAMPPGHPSVATSLLLRASILIELGRLPEALADAERGTAMFAARSGEGQPDSGGAYTVIAAVHVAAGRPAQARAALAHVPASLEGPDREDYHRLLGQIEELEGHRARALEELTKALTLTQARVGAGHPQVTRIQHEIDALSRTK